MPVIHESNLYAQFQTIGPAVGGNRVWQGGAYTTEAWVSTNLLLHILIGDQWIYKRTGHFITTQKAWGHWVFCEAEAFFSVLIADIYIGHIRW